MTRITARLRLAAACAAAFAALAPASAGEPLDGYELMLVPDRTVLTPANPTATVTLMGGWFGEDAGFGPNAFHEGEIAADEPTLSLVGAAPHFWNGPDSGEGSTDVRLNNVIWYRGLVPGGQPMPSPYGANEFVPIGTFTFTAADFSDQRSVMLVAEGSGSAITEWVPVGFEATWVWQIALDSRQTATASTWLIVVPAPGAAAPLLAVGALALSRRRRRSAS